MKLICRPRRIIGKLRPKKNVEDILNAGFEMALLDITALCLPGEFEDVLKDNSKREAGKIYLTENPSYLQEEAEKRIVSFAKNQGLVLPIAIAPSPAPDIKYKNKSGVGERYIKVFSALSKETLLLAVKNKCKKVIIPPLFLEISSEDEWEINREFYLELAKAADELKSDIKILLLNQLKNVNGHFVRGICAEAEEACTWIDELNMECGSTKVRFGMCLDIGVATIAGQNLYNAIVPFGNKLEAVIIRDTDGIHDVSMLPYTACIRKQQTSWLDMIRALRKIAFDGDLIMDFTDTYDGYPDLLKKSVIKKAYEIGKFFIWHINIEKTIKKYQKRVLFGAGNMCIAYLKNYGEKYPPLFTCDNNESRWGEEFYGITVENPEKLRDISSDTAIFICNIYYDEITEQLQKMGLPNPIEWFNDGYMASFDYERTDMAVDPRKVNDNA